MKLLLKGFASLVLFLLTCSTQAVADPIVVDPTWKVTVTNNTGMTVIGVHLNFTGTGGTIQNPVIVMNAAGAGNATVTVTNSGSAVDVSWLNPPGLPAGGTFMVQFTTNFPELMFNDGFWTLAPPLPQDEVDPNRDQLTVQEVPEPFTLLLFATGLTGVAIRSRRKPKDSSGDRAPCTGPH